MFVYFVDNLKQIIYNVYIGYNLNKQIYFGGMEL